MGPRNTDDAAVESFGREWQRFDQSGSSEEQQQSLFESYFQIIPWDKLPLNAIG